MSLHDVTSTALSRWMDGTGPENDVVLSSRIRLARNLEGVPFPHLLEPAQAETLLRDAQKATTEFNRYGFLGKVGFYRLADVAPVERQMLVEKHLISPAQAEDVQYKAVVLSEDESVSIMVNEEDHLRIQCLFPGLQLQETWSLANRVDDAFEQSLSFAFSEVRGYLTACPTNVGTGMRASVMMHLPALSLTNQAGRVLNSVGQLGVAVRGLYGEGTEALGNIFQVSNQITIGRSEVEIIDHLSAVVTKIIDQERQARGALQRDAREQVEDKVSRAFGLLTSARIMTSDEAMRLLSDVRLGINLGMIKEVPLRTMNELLVMTRPAYLQRLAGRDLSPFERDLQRAALIRSKLVK
ncbi:MAG: protein arginine kinase [Symbiobacteriia bacterium]